MRVGSLFSGVGGFDRGLERSGMTILWQVEYDKQCQQILRHRFTEARIHTDVRDVGFQLAERERTAEPTGGKGGRTALLTGSSDSASSTTVEGKRGRGQHSTERQPNPVWNADRPTAAGGRTTLAPVDLICGGFPCQDLSVAGKRAGLAGEKSGLWHEFHRIIGELAPRWVLIENVPGLLSSNGGADLAIILHGLEELGYGWARRILDSQYFGVPQRRRRVFIVGCLGDQRAAFDTLFPVGTSLPGHPAPSRTAGSRVAPILEVGARTNGDGYRDGDGIGQAGDPMFTLQASKQHGIAPCLRGQAYNNSDPTMEAQMIVGPHNSAQTLVSGGRETGPHGALDGVNLVAHTLTGEGHDASEDGTGRGTPIVMAQAGANAEITYDKSPTLTGVHDGPPITFQNTGHGWWNESDTAQAVRTAEHGGGALEANVAVQSAPRRLTPMECERLQGFPDNWTLVDGMKDGPRYRMMGNAVTVNVAEWIGHRIMEVQ